MTTLYHTIESNMEFLKEMFDAKETLNKLNINPEFRVYNENGEDLDIQLYYDSKFASKKRRGIEEGKTYYLMKGFGDEWDEIASGDRLYVNQVIDDFIYHMPQGVYFTTPVVLDKNSGKYYKVIGIGFDRNFHIVIWCKEIK